MAVTLRHRESDSDKMARVIGSPTRLKLKVVKTQKKARWVRPGFRKAKETNCASFDSGACVIPKLKQEHLVFASLQKASVATNNVTTFSHNNHIIGTGGMRMSCECHKTKIVVSKGI